MNWLKYKRKDKSTWPKKDGWYLVYNVGFSIAIWGKTRWVTHTLLNVTHYMKIEPPTI